MTKLFKNMTLEEKVGQLFIVRPEALDPSLTPEQVENTKQYGLTALTDTMKETLKKYPVGGVAFFGKNIENPEQLTAFTKDLAACEGIPLFIGIDEEGGQVARIGNNPNFSVPTFESMGKLGEAGDVDAVRRASEAIGGYLKEYGFNLNFAPVADVNTNPENVVIGDRAFGNDPIKVRDMVAAAMDGLQSADIIPCAKHFPGHGDTKGDTHNGTVMIDKTWEELLPVELEPFRLISIHVHLLMVSHITAKNITTDGLPASLSKEMITGKLRGELKMRNTIVITDSMSMKAITDHYNSGEAAVMAIQAGVDIVLMPQNLEEAFESVLAAVKNGAITESQLNDSIIRILHIKEQYHLF